MRLLRYRPPAALEALVVAMLAAALIWPLFKLKYADKWASIESTFIADARYLNENWPHPQWQPLWYSGTRFDYVYPPALRYGTAILARTFPILPVRAYHLYTAIFYALGIGGVFLLARGMSGSRAAGWLAALSTALVSPSFLLLKEIRQDAWMWVPQRLGVLVRYGEGPHITAVSLLGFALYFTFRALEKWRPAHFAAAAICCALVVSNNFYGATSLTIFTAILLWSVWITHQDLWIFVRAAGVALLAYSLTSFWLVPSYLKITSENLRFVADEGNLWSMWVAIAMVVAYMRLTDKFARNRPERTYVVFLWGAFLFFSLNVFGNYYLNFIVIGVPLRLVPELDLCIILFAVEMMRRAWLSPARFQIARRVAVATILLVGLGTSYGYVRHAWHIFPRDPEYQKRPEFQVANWIHAYYPDARAYVAGSIRFWYNAWYDLPQVGGGSEQGLLNPFSVYAQYKVAHDKSLEHCLLWLKAAGADLLVVSGKNSREIYHDYEFPETFESLPVLYNYQDDRIYRVPRRYPGIVRVVERSRIAGMNPIRRVPEIEELRQYVDVLENGPESPGDSRWLGTDSLLVRARTEPGQAIALQMTYDRPWKAYRQGKPVPVHPDLLGNLWIDVPPGEHEITLVFETPWENLVGRFVTVIGLLLTLWLLWRGFRLRRATA